MNNIRKIALCSFDENDEIRGKVFLEVKWDKGLRKELKSMFALDLKDEIADMIYDEIINSLTKENIKNLLKE